MPEKDTPKENTPKEEVPEKDTPKENTPKEDEPAQGATYSEILGEAVEKETVSAAPPKKKKSHAGLIVLIVVIVVVVALVLVALFSYLNFSSRAKKTIENYWQTYVDSDAGAVIASVPAQFWDYVDETYGYTQSECADGVAYLFETTKAGLGEELSYDYTATGFSMSKSGVESTLSNFGLTCSKCVGYNVDAELVGEISSQTYESLGMWAVKIDGDWYDMTAMCDIDALCSSGYLDSAIYEVTFGEPIATYWNAFYSCDVDTIADFLPSGSWEFIEGAYGCDEATARDCMEEYITEGLTYSGIEIGTPIEFTASVTDVTLCEEDEVAEYNAYLTDELQADAIAYVTFDATMTAEGSDTIEDTSSAVMMEIDDEWYLYDNLYYFATACYYYAGEIVYGDTTAEDAE